MKQTHMMYALVTGIIMIILGVILYMAGVAFKPGMQYVSDIPFLIGIIMNGMAFSKANDGFVTFGNVFSSCFKASAIITLMSLVWAFIALMIFPEMVDKGMEIAQQKMAEQGMSGEKMDQAMEMTKKYFKVFMIGGIVFGMMFYGLIFSLISAAIAKKKGPNPNMGM